MNHHSITEQTPRSGRIQPLQFSFFRQDFAAGFVVFLVALPLCLGIALASEAPPISGLITGIIAGIVVAFFSGSELSVSGPAAGLTVTVIATQKITGGFDGLLVATIIAGAIQLILGFLRTGLLATFFPSSVIKGMLAGIGIIIAVKQLPHAIGWRDEFNPEEGMFCLLSPFCAHGFLSELPMRLNANNIGALCVASLALLTLVVWEKLSKLRGGIFKSIPGALVAVMTGVACNSLLLAVAPSMALTREEGQLVDIPRITGLADFFAHGPVSISSWLGKHEVWTSAVAIALIASVETLLCIEATDKLDPMRRVSRPNRELVAQGIGNITAGLLGGIPMTSVIVRSSANVYAGGRTRLAGFCHGLFLLVSVLAIPGLLSHIPLAALAAVLILVGYKLANVSVFRQVRASGYDQFLPFIVTLLGVVVLDLLTGVLIGTLFGLVVVLIMNHHAAFTVVRDDQHFYLRFAKDVTFLQKIALKKTLAQLPNDSHIVIDGGGAMFIDHDIKELLEDFKDSAESRNIKVEIRGLPGVQFDLLTALSQLRR
jgi:MFS superfamily sulfate permease-like transporter